MPGVDQTVCDVQRDVGATCSADLLGRPARPTCSADVHCLAGLRCLDDLCAPGIAEGASCDKSFECGTDLVCDPLEERCGSGVAVGDACLTPVHCIASAVCSGLTIGQVCIPAGPDAGRDAPGLPGVLEPCTDVCATGFTCAEGPVAGVCVPGVCSGLTQP
ncbi:MAG: hypothetical protein ACI9WU_005371 [Myxococcota bacterium]|jgi:hypothetical protein